MANYEIRKHSAALKSLLFILIATAFFYLGKHWESNGYAEFLNFDGAFTNSRPKNMAGVAPFKYTISNGSLDMDVFETVANVSSLQNGGVFRIDLCSPLMKDYVPCRDNIDVFGGFSGGVRGENLERHCPDEENFWFCLVPTPLHYKRPVPWPKSKDEVWYSNIPSTRLMAEKGHENWVVLDKDRYIFPGDGIAEKYLQQMIQMVPALAFGVSTRVVLDVGCGLASFGTSLLSHNVSTLSIAPKDVHYNPVQFSLERGLPAMVAIFAMYRLPYPSQAFDLIHCSQCGVDWTHDGGIFLLEVNRILRAGGHFAWATKLVDMHVENLQKAWNDMKDLADRICWKLVSKEGYITIWQKPSNNNCYARRSVGVQPSMCDVHDDPNDVWYVPLKTCISRLPGNELVGKLAKWPERLHTPPDRLLSVETEVYVSKLEAFVEELVYWKMIVKSYLQWLDWKTHNIHNVMDMRANLGGFTAALIDEDIDCWVMNVVPVSGPNTLPVIYDRGLIGVVHDWCEPFDTYPRSYDLLHASGLFSIERRRCEIAYIILEMDRILRPGGHAFIHDSSTVVVQVDYLARAVGWRTAMFDFEVETYGRQKVLYCQKQVLLS